MCRFSFLKIAPNLSISMKKHAGFDFIKNSSTDLEAEIHLLHHTYCLHSKLIGGAVFYKSYIQHACFVEIFKFGSILKKKNPMCTTPNCENYSDNTLSFPAY